MTLKECFTSMIHSFPVITTGILMSTMLFVSIFEPSTPLTFDIFWQVITLALLCSFSFFLLFSRKPLSANQMLVRMVLQFLFVLMLVISGASLFQWIMLLKWQELITFLASIMVVYAVVICTTIFSLKKSTDQLNEQLKLWKNKK